MDQEQEGPFMNSDSNTVPREEIDVCIFHEAPEIGSRKSALQANTLKIRVAAACQTLSTV